MTSSLLIPLLNAVVFLCAFVLSVIFTRYLIFFSHRFGLLDRPAKIKAHTKPIPFLGGVGVFLSFWLVIFAGILMILNFKERLTAAYPLNQIFSHTLLARPEIHRIFLGSFVMLLIGFLDDKFRWSPLKKMLGQIVAVSILMSLNLRINLFSTWGVWGTLVTFIWVLLIINAFNFIDSLDGHCAGIAFISSMTFFWMVHIINQPLVGLLLVTFAGALAGFLIHNFKPAKIFLGDNGSLFIGYMLASITLYCQYHQPHASFATTLIPVLIFGVPIYDTLSVVTVRLLRGIPPWRGDRNHFAHRLVKIGMSERVAVVFSYFVAFTIGSIAVLTTQVNFFGAIIVLVIFLSILAVIAFMEFYVTKGIHIERREE